MCALTGFSSVNTIETIGFDQVAVAWCAYCDYLSALAHDVWAGAVQDYCCYSSTLAHHG